MTHRVLSLLLLAASCPALASAQTPASTTTTTPLPRVAETVVVTGTIAPVQEASDARSVVTLTREDLDLFGLTTAIDALRLAAGVDVQARGPREVQSDLSLRGATFGQSLVLVDGTRINDSQTGHHNGEIPLPVSAIDRIEILDGAASAAHGADALGGVINIITRRDRAADARVEFGQFGYLSAEGTASGRGVPAGWLATGWARRSGGFTFDREFAEGGGGVRHAPALGWIFDVRHERRAFGANGFYGASPSKEWTDLTLATAGYQRATGAWTLDTHATWKNHGDHFRWDIAQPGFAENTHRTNSADVHLTATRAWRGSTRLSFGAAGGGDTVSSSNLGDHTYGRIGAFSELQADISATTTVSAGLRVDEYSAFGHSWNPGLSIASRPSSRVKLRASLAHAFRIPTYTELYYHDPVDLGTPTLRPESGWSLDGGADLHAKAWTLSVSPFRRWDHDVIDWVRASATDIWRSTNVRDVTTTGVEFSAARQWHQVAARGQFTAMTVDAPALNLMSKYVLAYAKQSLGISVASPLGAGLHGAINADHRWRADGQEYWLVGAKVSHAAGHASVFIDGTNLLNRQYHEIAGVDLPGRWITAGLSIW